MSHSKQSANAPPEGPNKPWWREPWPWIIMAGPAAAIIGCIITIVLAVQNFSDQAIEDGGVKKGLVVSKQPLESPPAPPPKSQP